MNGQVVLARHPRAGGDRFLTVKLVIHRFLKLLDPRLRGDDERQGRATPQPSLDAGFARE